MRQIDLWAGVLALVLVSEAGSALDVPVKMGGSGRVRAESHTNQAFVSTAPAGFVGSRFRLNVSAGEKEKSGVFFQPQFSHVWGAPETVGTGVTGTAVNGGVLRTSGGLHNVRLDVHQAYLRLKFFESLTLWLGRQELVYGDELVVGSVGWDNIGRSFDGVRARYGFNWGWADLFWSRITETVPSGNDNDFLGFYFCFCGDTLPVDLELYTFANSNRATTNPGWLGTFGARSTGDISALFYRVEATVQTVQAAYQVDGDVGVAFFGKKFKVSGGYFIAGSAYNQLYPTAHKWLGVADSFARRNVQGPRVGLGYKANPNSSVKMDYHLLMKTDSSVAAVNFAGLPYAGTAGGSALLAHEVDVQAKYKLSSGVSMVAGGGLVLPVGSLATALNGNVGTFAYAGTSMAF